MVMIIVNGAIAGVFFVDVFTDSSHFPAHSKGIKTALESLKCFRELPSWLGGMYPIAKGREIYPA